MHKSFINQWIRSISCWVCALSQWSQTRRRTLQASNESGKIANVHIDSLSIYFCSSLQSKSVNLLPLLILRFEKHVWGARAHWTRTLFFFFFFFSSHSFHIQTLQRPITGSPTHRAMAFVWTIVYARRLSRTLQLNYVFVSREPNNTLEWSRRKKRANEMNPKVNINTRFNRNTESVWFQNFGRWIPQNCTIFAYRSYYITTNILVIIKMARLCFERINKQMKIAKQSSDKW